MTNTQISAAHVAALLLAAKPVNTMCFSSTAWYPLPRMSSVGAANATESSVPLSSHYSPPQALGCTTAAPTSTAGTCPLSHIRRKHQDAPWRGHITRQEAIPQLGQAQRRPWLLICWCDSRICCTVFL